MHAGPGKLTPLQFFSHRFTNESRDWFADAVAYKTDDFVKQINADFPGASATTALFGDPQVRKL